MSSHVESAIKMRMMEKVSAVSSCLAARRAQ